MSRVSINPEDQEKRILAKRLKRNQPALKVTETGGLILAVLK